MAQATGSSRAAAEGCDCRFLIPFLDITVRLMSSTAAAVLHDPTANAIPTPTAGEGYNRFLLLVAGLGGLLYGVDVGIIAGALPYLEAASGLDAGQLSFIVAASCSAA